MIYNVVLISGVQQSESVIHTYSHSFFKFFSHIDQASQVALVVKNLPASAGDIRGAGLIPGLGRSPGGGHDHPLHYSCLENLID